MKRKGLSYGQLPDEHPGREYPPTQELAQRIADANGCDVELFRANPPHFILFTASNA